MNTATMNLDQLKQLRDTAETSLREIREQVANLENADREKRLDALKPTVIRAHSLLCSWNHTDGCSWSYAMDGQKHNWTGWAHARWLRHYEELIFGKHEKWEQPVTVQTLTQMLDAVENLRKIDPQALWLIRHGICSP